ncbi:hypothetical protein F511_19489 [Dorcoceras hygrometricum]|uniref:Uncharacterized protein n=1 Tax=Dorcoceras hygrometricum TaxID=472368 RepID=A0A2Z7BFF8_9LAMI|nr:hypothetical protein F511_19489 [Dorcoceras hygrometricum]
MPKKGEGESSQGPQPPPAIQIRDSGNAGGSGDVVRTTELTQADIDAANRQILERMMREDRERERERRSKSRRSRTPQNPLLFLNTLSSVSMRESQIQYLCDPQWFRDTASRGPTTIVAPESQFRTCPSDHDSIGYPRMSASGESSTTMHRLLHASWSHPIPPPNDPKTNQYNQDLGLIHSTNGNHLESPNEGSSIDHQVTIYLHA